MSIKNDGPALTLRSLLAVFGLYAAASILQPAHAVSPASDCEGRWTWLPDYVGDNEKAALYLVVGRGRIRMQQGSAFHFDQPMVPLFNTHSVMSVGNDTVAHAILICPQLDQATLVLEFQGEQKEFTVHRTSQSVAAWSS